MGKRYTFTPVGLDRFDPRPYQPAAGAVVVKTRPAGCPGNTGPFVFVKDAETDAFYGLVLRNSLTEV